MELGLSTISPICVCLRRPYTERGMPTARRCLVLWACWVSGGWKIGNRATLFQPPSSDYLFSHPCLYISDLSFFRSHGTSQFARSSFLKKFYTPCPTTRSPVSFSSIRCEQLYSQSHRLSLPEHWATICYRTTILPG